MKTLRSKPVRPGYCSKLSRFQMPLSPVSHGPSSLLQPAHGGVAARGCRPPAAAMYVDVCQRMSMYVNVFQCVCVSMFFLPKNEVVVANGSTVAPGGDDILVGIEFSTPPGFSAACQRCVLASMSHSMS